MGNGQVIVIIELEVAAQLEAIAASEAATVAIRHLVRLVPVVDSDQAINFPFD